MLNSFIKHKSSIFFYRTFINKKLKFIYINSILHYHRPTDVSISRNETSSIKSLIYLAIKMIRNYSFEQPRVERAMRHGRKNYKKLSLKNEIKLIVNELYFIKKYFHLSSINFIIISFLFKRGFDKMKL